MIRADWEAATPKCPKGDVTNVPGAICSEPLRWEPWMLDDGGVEIGRWVCPVHGAQLTGTEAAWRAGFAAVWVGEAA